MIGSRSAKLNSQPQLIQQPAVAGWPAGWFGCFLRVRVLVLVRAQRCAKTAQNSNHFGARATRTLPDGDGDLLIVLVKRKGESNLLCRPNSMLSRQRQAEREQRIVTRNKQVSLRNIGAAVSDSIWAGRLEVWQPAIRSKRNSQAARSLGRR